MCCDGRARRNSERPTCECSNADRALFGTITWPGEHNRTLLVVLLTRFQLDNVIDRGAQGKQIDGCEAAHSTHLGKCRVGTGQARGDCTSLDAGGTTDSSKAAGADIDRLLISPSVRATSISAKMSIRKTAPGSPTR